MTAALKDCRQYWRLYLLSLVLGIGASFQYGIQVSIMASPAEHVQNFVNTTWLGRYEVPVADSTNKLIWSFMVSVFCLGGWLGSFHSGSLPVRYGRKKALLFNNLVAMVAAVLMVFSRIANSFEMILVGRILYGYNAGLGLSVQMMYLGESSPKKIRGFMAFTCCIFISFGKVMAQIIGIKELMGTEDMWPYLLAVGGIPAVMQFVGLFYFPEAPRYLYIDKGDIEGSKKALQWLWQEGDLKIELDDMSREKESMQGKKAKTVMDVLCSPSVRLQLLIQAIPCAMVSLCGITALNFYAFDILRESGVSEDKMHYLSAGVGVVELVTVSLSSLLIEHAGRKKLMGYGYLLLGVTMAILTVTLSLKHLSWYMPYLNIGLIFIFMCIYGLGPSGVSVALPTDLFLQAWRPSAYMVSGTINWVCLFLIGMLFPYIVDGLGQFCFLIFVAYCIFSAAFILYFVPETKGKTMMEIMEDFNKLNFKNRKDYTEKVDFAYETKF